MTSRTNVSCPFGVTSHDIRNGIKLDSSCYNAVWELSWMVVARRVVIWPICPKLYIGIPWKLKHMTCLHIMLIVVTIFNYINRICKKWYSRQFPVMSSQSISVKSQVCWHKRFHRNKHPIRLYNFRDIYIHLIVMWPDAWEIFLSCEICNGTGQQQDLCVCVE